MVLLEGLWDQGNEGYSVLRIRFEIVLVWESVALDAIVDDLIVGWQQGVRCWQMKGLLDECSEWIGLLCSLDLRRGGRRGCSYDLWRGGNWDLLRRGGAWSLSIDFVLLFPMKPVLVIVIVPELSIVSPTWACVVQEGARPVHPQFLIGSRR